MTPEDLFTWEAERAAKDAEAQRAAAAKAVRTVPHAEILNRRERLRQATNAALAAEVELQRRREGRT